MTKSIFTRGLFRRSAISVAISVCFASSVMAQSSDGSLFGRAQSKAKITITNIENGTSRQIEAHTDGTFSIAKVSPGKYQVSTGGVVRNVEVVIGTGTEVKFDDTNTVVVTGSRTRNAIDVSSVESNTVFTQAEIQSMPIARSATAVAMLSPGTVQGDSGFGVNLPSFGGASIAENGYYINGMDVTNLRSFLSFAQLPFDAIEQQQIKTGGYGSEYGRSLGGVVGLTSKRGSNTWKGVVGVIYSPNTFSAKPLLLRDKEVTVNPDGYRLFNRFNTSDSTEVNASLGGPIIKDKLFIWGMVTNTNSYDHTYTRTSSSATESGRPNGIIKLDYAPNGDHRFEVTAITNHSKTYTFNYVPTDPPPYATYHIGDPRISWNKNLATVFIGKYTGYITDDLTVSLLTGGTNAYTGLTKGANATRPYNPNDPCPAVTGPLSGQRQGCYAFPTVTSRDPKAPENFDKRRNTRLDLEYNLGSHHIRAGLDLQNWKSALAGNAGNSAGKTYAYATSTTGTVNFVPNAVPKNGQFVSTTSSYSTSGIYEVLNDAKYIEDTWRVAKNMVLYGGLRWESFINKNAEGTPFVDKKNLLAPRLGAAWDVNGDASLKIYGNAGRYYIPVAANTNFRMTRLSYSETNYYTFTGKDPVSAVPTGLTQVGSKTTTGSEVYPNPGTLVDPNLKPMNQDEYILGFQKAWGKDMSIGVKYTNRRINAGMDDYCGTAQIAKFVKDKGNNNFDPKTIPTCVLINPGEDLTLMLDLNNDKKLVRTTIPSSNLGVARYERRYDALEFSLDRPFDGTWGAGASYVWSKSRGTAEGYVQSNLNQADPGLTQDFDYGSLTDGSFGYLPNDRTHQFKLFGSYKLNDTWTAGFNSRLISGRPTSCIGFVPPTVFDFNGPNGTTSGGVGGYNSASSYYCLNDAGVTELKPRGTGPRTPWTKQLDLSLNYNKKIGSGLMTIQFSLVNVFDSRTVQEWTEVRDFSRTQPTRVNLNYKAPSIYQTPRYLRLSARYAY
jgi:hypothetical protein